jgi:hypothetical protein
MVPQVAVLRDLCEVIIRKARVCEYADTWQRSTDSTDSSQVGYV